jgi:hypothetical protein
MSKIPEKYTVRLDPDQTNFSVVFGRQRIDMKEMVFSIIYKTPSVVEQIFVKIDFKGKDSFLYQDSHFVIALKDLICELLGIHANTFNLTPVPDDANNFEIHSAPSGISVQGAIHLNDVVARVRGLTSGRIDPVEPQPEEFKIQKKPKAARKDPLFQRFKLPQLHGICHGSPRNHEFSITTALVEAAKDDPNEPVGMDGIAYISLVIAHDYHTDLLRNSGSPWFINYIQEDLRALGLAVSVHWDNEDRQSMNQAALVVTPMIKSSEKNVLKLMRHLYNDWSDEQVDEEEEKPFERDH